MMKRNENDINQIERKGKNGKHEKLIPDDAESDDINILTSYGADILPKSLLNSNYKCDSGCHFDKKTEKEVEKARKARKKLLFASVFCVIFMIAELVGGFLAGSIALMSDALHLLSDCGGLMISVFALVTFLYKFYSILAHHNT